MLEKGTRISSDNLPGRFVELFDEKIKTILSKVEVDNEVYSGTKKVTSAEKMFMDANSVKRVRAFT
jgi:hypothetical protein